MTKINVLKIRIVRKGKKPKTMWCVPLKDHKTAVKEAFDDGRLVFGRISGN